MKVSGFTNRKLRRTGLFGDGIISLPKDLAEINELDISFCSAERHEDCSVAKKCKRKRPDCHSDRKGFVGKKIFEDFTENDHKKMERILAAEYKKCRLLKIEIKDEQGVVR